MGVRIKPTNGFERAYMRFQEEIICKIESAMKEQNVSAYALSKKTGISQSTLSQLFNREVDILSIPLAYTLLLALDVKMDIGKVQCGIGDYVLKSQNNVVIPESIMGHTITWDEKMELMQYGRISSTVKICKTSGYQNAIIYVNKKSGLVSVCNIKSDKYELSREQIFNLIDGLSVEWCQNGKDGSLQLDLDSGRVKFHPLNQGH